MAGQKMKIVLSKEIEFNEDADYEVSLSFTDDGRQSSFDIETQTFYCLI